MGKFKNRKVMRMKRIVKIFFLTLMSLIIIYIIYLHTLYNYNFYSSLIEIRIPIFAKMEEKDTHGGFHGDGEALAKVYFSDKQTQNFISKINNNSNWKDVPMPEVLQHKVYNSIEEEMKVPFIENGYWLFINRYSKVINKHDYNEILGKASSNFSVAIFDKNQNILYIYSLDT